MDEERPRPLIGPRPCPPKDPSKRDPLFETAEEATQFLQSCAISKTIKEPQQPMENVCTCENCTEKIVFMRTENGEYEHLCCRQLQSWSDKFSYDADIRCVTDTRAFIAVTNDYAVNNLILHSWKTNKQDVLENNQHICDPPTNSNMRFGNYRAASLLLEGMGERRPLPACTMHS